MTNPNLARAFAPALLNGLHLRNRFIAAAAFEGKTPGGVVTPALVEHHRRYGEGGIGMTTIGYCAAESDGRLDEHMLFMDEYVREPLGAMIATIQATGARVSGQLGHAGGFTKNRKLSTRRPLGPSFGLNRLGAAEGLPFVGEASVEQIRARVATLGRAAAFMKSVGFDAIEIHFGHGYGISQFISPLTNRRSDAYGGTLDRRLRFPLEVLAAVREAVGPTFPLLGKISMSDGVPGGVDYDESFVIAQRLGAAGVDCLICSDGTSSFNPMLLFRGESMQAGLVAHEKNPLTRLGMRVIGPWFFKQYDYYETYLLERAKRIRDAVTCQTCYVGGVSTNESVERVMSAGFDFIQLGRALIYDPDFVRNAGNDPTYASGCTHCNRCATLIAAEGGVRCPER